MLPSKAISSVCVIPQDRTRDLDVAPNVLQEHLFLFPSFNSYHGNHKWLRRNTIISPIKGVGLNIGGVEVSTVYMCSLITETTPLGPVMFIFIIVTTVKKQQINEKQVKRSG